MEGSLGLLRRESCGAMARTEGMREYHTNKLIFRVRKMRGSHTLAERKLAILESLGLRIVHFTFTSDKVNYRFNSVCTQIRSILLLPE